MSKRTLIGIAAPQVEPRRDTKSDAPAAEAKAKTSQPAPGQSTASDSRPAGKPAEPKQGESLADTHPDRPLPKITRRDSKHPSTAPRRSSVPPGSHEPPPRVASIAAGSEAPPQKGSKLWMVLLVAAVGVLAVWFSLSGRGDMEALNPPPPQAPAATPEAPRDQPPTVADDEKVTTPPAPDDAVEPGASASAAASVAEPESSAAPPASASAVPDDERAQKAEPKANQATADAPAAEDAKAEDPKTGEAAASGDVRIITVTITPPDAKLYRRGKLVGQSPVRIELPAGEKRAYEVGRPGYRTRKLVVDGTESEISIGLRPDADASAE